jgi:alcohol dehydrogenase class IV
MTNAVFMPYVLVFNRPAVEEKLARVAAYLGLKPSFDGFLDFVMGLRAELGVPHSLPEFGVSNPDITLLARMAPQDPTAGGNPVPLDEQAAAALFEKAMAGRV